MEYKFKRVENNGYVIIENGHTMFPEDVKTRLDRLNYLEKQKRDFERRGIYRKVYL